MRQFDINNPWTKKEVKKEKKKTISIVIFSIVFLIILMSVTFLYFQVKDLTQAVLLIIIGSVVVVFPAIIIGLSFIQNTLITTEYNRLLNLTKENKKIKNYVDKVSKQGRKIINKELLKLDELDKQEKNDRIEQQIYGN